MPGRVLRLDLEYDGAGFSGWAAQPGLRTVEGALREALGTLIGDDFELAVAGRTDAGVHASGQVASVATDADVEVGRLLRGLNALLPPDVSVREVAHAAPGFDARWDARSRRYEYRVLPGPRSALRRARVLHHPAALDPGAMADAAGRALGRHDFRAFTPTRTDHVTFERTLTRCEWARRGDELVLTVEADAFLRHMVRVLAGTLLLVGRGAWRVDRFARLLDGAPRGAAGPTAPAHALTLTAVGYGDRPVSSGPPRAP